MKKDNNYKVFLILKGKKDQSDKSNIPLWTFISKNYTEAEVYFKGYITDEEDALLYKLYKIGEINERNELEPCKVFICGGYEAKARKQNFQLKLKNVLNKENIEIIKELFDGEYINEQRFSDINK